MTAEVHEQVVRRSFDRQVGLFSGPDSPFAQRPAGTASWLEPLTDDMAALDVACGHLRSGACEPLLVLRRKRVALPAAMQTQIAATGQRTRSSRSRSSVWR